MNSAEKHSSTRAVALAYQSGEGAPRIVAQGQGLIAEAIIQRANKCGVHVHQSSELVALLMQLDLDQEIPPALYRAVAELLAWLYQLESDTASVHHAQQLTAEIPTP